jgi:hypothetical protein
VRSASSPWGRSSSWCTGRTSASRGRSAETAALLEEGLFAPDIARSKAGEPPTEARERFRNWLWDKLASFL